MIQICTAKTEDFEAVQAFYHGMIDAMKDWKQKPGWKKGIYPSDELLKGSIQQQELHYLAVDGQIAGACILNNQYNEQFDLVPWQKQLAREQVLVVHALAIHPAYARRGYAGKLLAYGEQVAKKRDVKALRLDVLSGNVPAEKTYLAYGFQYLGITKMTYPDTGLADFLMFEKLL